jgi:tRNA modification GTPase
MRVHDTAGIRATTQPVESEGVRRAHQTIEHSNLVLLVTDSDDDDTVRTLQVVGKTLITVRNKIDRDGTPPRLGRDEHGYRVRLSAKTGQGLDLLEQALRDAAGAPEQDGSPFIARERHIDALQKAAELLDPEAANLAHEAPELLAERLRQARRQLGMLTGEATTEELLGEIFSRFCIGK